MVKSCLQCSIARFNPWVGKSPWRRTWLPSPVSLPGESHGQRNMTEQRNSYFSVSWKSCPAEKLAGRHSPGGLVALPRGIALGAPTSLCPAGHHTLQGTRAGALRPASPCAQRTPGASAPTANLRGITPAAGRERLRPQPHPGPGCTGRTVGSCGRMLPFAGSKPRPGGVTTASAVYLWPSPSFCSVGVLGSIPGLGRSPEEGKGYPLQCSGLENSVDSVAHGVAESWTQLSDCHSLTSSDGGQQPCCLCACTCGPCLCKGHRASKGECTADPGALVRPPLHRHREAHSESVGLWVHRVWAAEAWCPARDCALHG